MKWGAQLIACEAICSACHRIPSPSRVPSQHTSSSTDAHSVCLLPTEKELPMDAQDCGRQKCACSRTRTPKHMRVQVGPPSLPKREPLNLTQPSIHHYKHHYHEHYSVCWAVGCKCQVSRELKLLHTKAKIVLEVNLLINQWMKNRESIGFYFLCCC